MKVTENLFIVKVTENQFIETTETMLMTITEFAKAQFAESQFIEKLSWLRSSYYRETQLAEKLSSRRDSVC